MIKKAKKAQFFIIAGLIGAIVIFGFISVITFKKPPKPEKFYDLSKNFKYESIEVLAKGKLKEYEGKGKLEDFLFNFTKDYLKYALHEDPNIEVIWVYGNSSRVTIYNFAESRLNVFYKEHGKTQETEIEGGKTKIQSEMCMGDACASITQRLETYEPGESSEEIQNTNMVTLQIANLNYTFELGPEEKFYLVLKTEREKEVLIKKE